MRAARAAVVLLAAAALAAFLLAGCEHGPAGSGSRTEGTPAAPPAPPDADPSILPTRQVAPAPVMRLARGLAPPTNRWFSSLALGPAPQPVFPLPLAVGVTPTGFGVGVPRVTTTAKGAFGPYAPQVTVTVPGAATPQVTAYDTASVTVTLGPGRLTIVEGSPVLHWTSTTAATLGLDVAFAPGGPDDSAVAKVGDRTWLLVATGGDGRPAAPALAADGRSVRVPRGGHVAWVALPDGLGADDQRAARFATAAAAPVTRTTLRYAAGSRAASTAVDYGAATAVVRLPHQTDAAPGGDLDCAGLGGYATVLGTATACLGRTAAWSVPAVAPAATLDVAHLPAAQRAELATSVAADARRLAGPDAPADPADTYFGGKALARDAHLLTLATALGRHDAATLLRTRLDRELRQWTDPKGCTQRADHCFVLDPVQATVVGLADGFGSEQANDHHFHYGYFLEAAAIAAADDAQHGDGTLTQAIAPVVDLLAADVAASGPVPTGHGPDLPALRVFDAFAGHSWASGYAPFADGNNQESSSEAVNAWNGLALWEAVRGDAPREAEARWLLASEAASARDYWVAPDTHDPAVAGIGAQVTSLVWGGKREHATWFSADPSAPLAIEVLPVTPASGYLAGPGGTPPDRGARIRANLAEALATSPGDLWADPQRWDVPFGDQLLAYAALGGPDDAAHALDVARTLPAARIDDGDTRSWLLAWILTRE
ncbi:MAG: glycosyl hydrolase [Promicromonosporaceae bacterium]|nr:glycosyl hydrolase [Promicromonosporaceae bacterium]